MTLIFRRASCLLCASFALIGPPAFANPATCDAVDAPLSAIRFEGNKKTRERTMTRELTIAPGQNVLTSDLEHARRDIENLGLFREVTMSCELDDAGVIVTYAVREKLYLFATPRADANSDGETAVGAHLSWHNAFGRNHTIRATVLQRKSEQTGRGTSTEYRISHDIPFIGSSSWGFQWNLAHEIDNLETANAAAGFQEVSDQVGLNLRHHLSDGPASQGWSVGLGLLYEDQYAKDGGPDFGRAISLIPNISYRDRQNYLYSDGGFEGFLSLGRAQDGWGSDYSQTTVEGILDWAWPIGHQAHQTLGLRLETLMLSGGPRDGLNEYSVGGAQFLRGYEKNVAEGDAFAVGSLEFLRLTPWQWLRYGLFLQAGGAWGGDDAINQGILVSAGPMLQIRPVWFVGLVINIGIGMPLLIPEGVDSKPAFFGSGR